jgi:hypothetical protein
MIVVEERLPHSNNFEITITNCDLSQSNVGTVIGLRTVDERRNTSRD